jgi:hypothetical protein
MKNPQNGEWYLLAINGDTHYITVTFSKIGVARAWHGYSDTVLATANGYGYDKESTVLANACAKLANIKALENAAGVGVESLKRLVTEHKGRLYSRTDALDFIYQDIKAKGY